MESVWPNGNRCAACFTFDLDAEWVFMGNDHSVADKPRIKSQGEYVWNSNIILRILDKLDEFHIKSTFFVVAQNATNHPEVVREIADRGHEVATHGWKHEKVDHLPYDEEKVLRVKMIKALEDVTGVRPVGNRVAGGEIGPNTHDILKELGFLYDSSMRGSDMPYKLDNGLVIVPSYYEMDDFHLFADYPMGGYKARMMSPETGYEIWTNAFKGYYGYGLCWTSMFHPQIIGKPGNMVLLDKLLRFMKKPKGVWFANAKEIAEHWNRVK
jgi:peptidoglycan/xylan/chitin deacetylase (PgdA/CDA1 family)